jgi:hypothetical protein
MEHTLTSNETERGTGMRTYKAMWVDADGNIVEVYWFHRVNANMVGQIISAVTDDMIGRYGNTDYINAGHVEVQ